MFRKVMFALAMVLTSQAFAQQADGICWIYKTFDDGTIVDWCGVAVSDQHIASCGHHGVSGDVRVQFCIEKHGSKFTLNVPGKIVATDMTPDLSVITFEMPKGFKVKSYGRIGRAKKNPEVIGYLMGKAEVRRGPIGRVGNLRNGLPITEVQLIATEGMSGSPLIEDGVLCGILTGTDKRRGTSDYVDPQVLADFLNAHGVK